MGVLKWGGASLGGIGGSDVALSSTAVNEFDSATHLISAFVGPSGTVYNYTWGVIDTYCAKMPVTPGVRYSFAWSGDTEYQNVAYLDAAGTKLGTGWQEGPYPLVNQEGLTFVAPDGCAHVLIPVAKDSLWSEVDTFTFRQGLEIRPNEVTAVGGMPVADLHTRNLAKSRWTGKQWWAYGDSITNLAPELSTKNYWGHISDRLGVTVTQQGQASSCFHEYVTGTDTNLTRDIYERIKNVSPLADLVTVFIGTNDYTQGLTGVGIGTATDTTDATIAGCVYLTIQAVAAIAPNATIAFITPLPRADCHPANEVAGKNGWTMGELADIIVAVCRRYSVPCLDAYHTSSFQMWNADNVETYTYAYEGFELGDGLHPNTAGHEMFSWQVQAFLESL